MKFGSLRLTIFQTSQLGWTGLYFSMILYLPKTAKSDLGELALVTKRSKSEPGSKIQVLTKAQRAKKEPTGDELEEGEIQTNQQRDHPVHFETIVKGNDFDFYNYVNIDEFENCIAVGNILQRFFGDISFSRTNSNGTYSDKE